MRNWSLSHWACDSDGMGPWDTGLAQPLKHQRRMLIGARCLQICQILKIKRTATQFSERTSTQIARQEIIGSHWKPPNLLKKTEVGLQDTTSIAVTKQCISCWLANMLHQLTFSEISGQSSASCWPQTGKAVVEYPAIKERHGLLQDITIYYISSVRLVTSCCACVFSIPRTQCTCYIILYNSIRFCRLMRLSKVGTWHWKLEEKTQAWSSAACRLNTIAWGHATDLDWVQREETWRNIWATAWMEFLFWRIMRFSYR